MLDGSAPIVLVRGGRDALDPAQVGKKFARLEQMRRASMCVPDLFCIPAAMFDAALAALPGCDFDDVHMRCAAMADGLRALKFPPAWADPLLAAFDEQFGPDARVAVRACVVPTSTSDGKIDDAGEDGEHDPFAGMSDSYLYVTRDRLLDRIAACWASAFTERSVQYRTWRGLDPARARVAVGIQRMVEATRSFVAFTRDPRNGERCVVIAAAHGIGEGLVQEKADVDHFFVADGRVRAEVVHKEWMVDREGRRASDALAVQPVPRELAECPVLTDREA